ncbi:hypothetical protein Y1Q_0002335 [Alligator mississippiensis]|uniref:Uncharacterized protein n=1 Tax=Alligator mississippiensis TaxID=8496 RepID=A0A151MGQ8_ALLMI|nr:hypothetical protein Y1Q_0002335 [Alligator mississippiensis]
MVESPSHLSLLSAYPPSTPGAETVKRITLKHLNSKVTSDLNCVVHAASLICPPQSSHKPLLFGNEDGIFICLDAWSHSLNDPEHFSVAS